MRNQRRKRAREVHGSPLRASKLGTERQPIACVLQQPRTLQHVISVHGRTWNGAPVSGTPLEEFPKPEQPQCSVKIISYAVLRYVAQGTSSAYEM